MDKVIIYVAGNPNAYPLEYFNPESGMYKGMIPRLLQDFSEKTIYDVRYYAPGAEDRRSSLAEKKQVDLVSGCRDTETFAHTGGADILLLEAQSQGVREQYRLCFTEVAPEAFSAQLREYFMSISQEQKTALLIDNQYASLKQQNHLLQGTLLGLGFVAALLFSAIWILTVKYRRVLKRERESMEFDNFTGLGNTAYLLRRFKSLVSDQNRILYRIFYFYINTEQIQHRSGQEQTNAFLIYTASSLLNYLSDGDILARVSDNGFAILRILSHDDQGIEDWIQTALKRIRSFPNSHSTEFSKSVTVGVYRLTHDDRDLNEIIFRAAQAARAAHRDGADYRMCTNELLASLQKEQRLQADAKNGLENGEFELYIQFYVNTTDQRVIGGEALSRWEHPQCGFLTSGAFIPFMEKEGLIDRLDFYLFEKSCAFLDRLSKAGIDDFFLSCNFSRITLSRGDFADRCRRILDIFRFDHGRLIFEITGSSMFQDARVPRENILAIKNMGIRIALDDFGESFSSFFDIQENALDVLKLDKVLVDNLGTVAGDAIVHGMIRVGHELGFEVFAQGIEQDCQIERLRMFQCDAVQGFRFYYPFPDREAEKKLLALVSAERNGHL